MHEEGSRFTRSMWVRVLLLVGALALAGIGQFVLIQENDRLQGSAITLEGATTEEIDRGRLLLAQVRDLAHRDPGGATAQLEASLSATTRQLEDVQERRRGLISGVPGPPPPSEVADRANALTSASDAVLDASDPVAEAESRLDEVERIQGQLSTLLAADQDARRQAIQAEVDQNEMWSFTIFAGILGLLLLAGTHVVRPAVDHIRQREARFEEDLRALRREMAAQEVAARDRERELEATIEDLQQFAYVASHDLQEPLRMVASYVQLLDRRVGDELGEDAEVFMEYIREGVDRMKQLIDDLLAYSRVGTRGDELAPTDLQAALDDALTNLQIAIDESDAQITSDELPRVLGDRSQLTQVFQNLVSNAIKFQPEDRRPRIHVGARLDEAGTWTISVADNGIGIHEDQRERIFVIFQRSQAREAYPGTGIGLAICKKIVERHEGKIWVESEGYRNDPASTNGDTLPAEPGDGATFKFTLQPAPEAQEEHPAGDRDRDPSVHDRSRELI